MFSCAICYSDFSIRPHRRRFFKVKKSPMEHNTIGRAKIFFSEIFLEILYNALDIFLSQRSFEIHKCHKAGL